MLFESISSMNMGMWKEIIFGLLGGLGLFLFGMHITSDSLKSLAGKKLKIVIEKSTNTLLKGIVVGFGLTCLIQSSSGTTALVVGLVSAGLMTLRQASGVIIGANIGGTITTLLFALNLGQFGPILAFIGAIMYVFVKKNKKVRLLGGALLGFGLIFWGLEIMGSGIKGIATYDETKNFLRSMSNVPILGLLVGTAFTMLIQSSGVTVGIVQGFGSSIDIIGAIAIVFGANIGTTITAVLSSLGGSSEAKRAALFHTIFNTFGAIIFMLLIYPYSKLLGMIETSMHLQRNMTIFLSHFLFNLLTAFVVFFICKYFVMLCEKIVRDKEQSPFISELKNIPIDSPALSLEISKKAIVYMSSRVHQMFDDFVQYSESGNIALYNDCMDIENEIDDLDKIIHNYLVKVSALDLLPDEALQIAKYIDTSGDLERIGDHCTNLIDFMKERYDNNQKISPAGYIGFKHLRDSISEMLNKTLDSFENSNSQEAHEVMKMEDDVIDVLEEKYRKEHIVRVYEGVCKVSLIDNYNDILSNLERIGDHLNNIAEKVSSGNVYSSDELSYE